jgi:endonuclease YncB( thermonuclease family)
MNPPAWYGPNFAAGIKIRYRAALSQVMTSMRWFILILTILAAGPTSAAAPTVRDGGTIDLGDATYRLDGIDVPAFDQICIDDHADPWACGVEARDQLAGLINGREVHCEDLGPDGSYRKWRLGLCTAEGETTSLNQLLVRRGFALNMAAAAGSRFGPDEAEAKNSRRGLWKGCLAAPQDFRSGRKDGALLGAACRADKDREIREVLFPLEPAMPSGCGIKGKYALRARVTGNIGIYHLQVCRSYPALTRPDRWFCSEDDAKASGFRKAYNCRPFTRQRS